MKILVLGGTEEARLLADALADRGQEVTLSYAGRTTEPVAPKCQVRVGGFGGADGLASFIAANGIDRLVDATHPFAVQMSQHAVTAAERTRVPLVRLTRLPWQEPQYAFWEHVGSVEEAADGLPRGARVLLAVGHRGLEVFLAREDCRFVVRLIEQPQGPLPAHATPLIQRPPYYVGAETELMRSHGITHLVAKNSGGVQTEAKLMAAQQLRVKVVMIARPQLPPAKEVPTVGQAIAALHLEN